MNTGRILLGVETEYAAATAAGSCSVDRAELPGALLDSVTGKHPHVFDRANTGAFLGNGARVYVDCGSHLEFATPECPSPRDVVAYIRAGERILLQAASDAVEPSVEVFRHNVDYIAGTTWGCHESYLHRCDPRRLWAPLIPHLVSRVIFAGAGGFAIRGSTVEFTLSPRAWQLEHSISNSSTEARAIVHTKDEALTNRPYHRLHLLCGESVCSDVSALLKVGTTALIVAALDIDCRIGDGMTLARPIASLRALASDPSFSVRLPMKDGSFHSALEIQQHYLDRVVKCRQAGRLPEWSDEIIRLWSHALDCLVNDPSWAEQTLDWGIKLAVFRRILGSAGWTGLKLSDALAYRLFEVDARFGQLGSRGIFEQLSAQGVLSARVLSENEIQHAVALPPAYGRGRIRGTLIRQMSALGTARDHVCDWTGLSNRANNNRVDLNDPFEERVRWGYEPSYAMI